jgi:outer membrane receptor for ferric coprogen and ferric-rhodotorulic acid
VLNGNGSLFINTDGDYQSVNNDETIAYRAWQSLSGDNNAYLQQNIDEREKRWGLNPYKFNLFTAYDFDEGRLKNFTIGGGYRYLSGAIIGEDPSGAEFTNKSEGYFDLMLRYRQRLNNGKRIDYQINVYNLLDKSFVNPIRYSDLDDSTSPLSRFALPVPPEIRATVTYSF